MKILISAYACEPHKGSEPAVGWNWVWQAARSHEVWVITRRNNEPIIAEFMARSLHPNVHWQYYDLPSWLRIWKRQKRGLHPYYVLWQLGAFRLAARLHREVGFDVVHHATFVNYWLPSFMALLPVAFVWGPVGGAESAPRAFYRTFSLKGRVFEHARDLARWAAERSPLLTATARRAAVALGTTPETVAALRSLGAKHAQVLSQVALDAAEYERLAELPIRTGGPFRLASIGTLLHLKGFHLALTAFAEFREDEPDAEYWIIGDGPERERLEQLARDLGIAAHTRFWGHVSRMEVLDALAECDVLLHPSLHDSGGFVCAEAMAAGRPVICLDLGGSAVLVSEECGVKVAAQNPLQVSSDLAAAMRALARNRQLRLRLGEAGRARVRALFDWDRKGDVMAEFYRLAAAGTDSGSPQTHREAPVPSGVITSIRS